MESSGEYFAEPELFNEERLLFSVDGDREDAKALLDESLAAFRGLLMRMRLHIEVCEFTELILAAANAHGFSVILASEALKRLAERMAKLAIERRDVELRATLGELELRLESFEARLKSLGLR